VSYDASGQLRWGFNIGSTSNDIGHAIAVGSNGAVLLAGEFQGPMDADPGPGTTPLTAQFQDAFTAKYGQPECTNVIVAIKAILQGPYVIADQLMADQLRSNGWIPLTEPYSAMGFAITGTSTTLPGVLSVTGPNAIVDWVLVELRDALTPSTVVERRAALIQRDGDVVAPDGVSTVNFCVHPSDYYVALRHRDHLGVMTATSLPLSSTITFIDLTALGTVTFGTDARHDLGGGIMALWPGNVVPDAIVRYTGSANDRDPILARIGGVVPTSTVNGYWPEDVNMDAVVKYTGAGNDRDIILAVIGGIVPSNTRSEQLP
jgi:hypothetical protein